MEMYNKVENDTSDTYLHDSTTGVAGHKYEKPNYNMKMV